MSVASIPELPQPSLAAQQERTAGRFRHGREVSPWTVLANAWRRPQRRATVILCVSLVLMVVWKYFGSIEYFHAQWAGLLPDGIDRDSAAAAYRFVSAFVLLGVVPALVVRLGFGQRLAEYGLQRGNLFFTFRSTLIMLPFLLLITCASACCADIAEYYPLNPGAGRSAGTFATHVGFYLLFYLGWEFHFRGFLQLGLRGTMGDTNALLVQVVASTLLHLGHPVAEVFGSLGGGILWGILVLRTRSLAAGFMQHASMGIVLDALLVKG